MNADDLKEIRGLSVQAIRESNNIIFSEMLKVEKLKNTWIGQLITLSSTLLGGFALMKDNPNCVMQFGLLVLFVTIVIGLFLIIHNLNSQSNNLTTTFAKQNDYSLRYITLTYLEQKKDELNENELKTKKEFEDYVAQFNMDIGILNNEGDLNSLSSTLPLDKISIGNYVLIIGFGIGGILIAFSDKILALICS